MNINLKAIKRAIAICLLVSMVMTGIPFLPGMSAAAKSKPKLSAKSVTVAMGGKQTIKLKNGKGKWKVQANGVIRVKSKNKTSITIVPIKAGKAVITCKCGKKKLTCKVKVLNNTIGKAEDYRKPTLVIGQKYSNEFELPEGVSITKVSYDKTIGQFSYKTESNDDGTTTVKTKVKALKPGRFEYVLYYLDNGEDAYEPVYMYFINDFRGKTKVKKTKSNYKKWRKKTISSMVDADMTTWEIIDAVGYLISSGKYSMKGGVSGMQLWYGSNGTCISGAQMMDDFMKDIGIKSKIRFMGNKAGATDIYGYTIMYAPQHKNTWVTIKGKKYELNPQPGMAWPIGIIKR